jgi:hypothetical protein
MTKFKLHIDRISWIFVWAALTTTASQIGLVFLTSNRMPPQVPLFYSLPWGDGQLTAAHGLWMVPELSAGVLIINFSVSVFLQQTVLTRILSSTAMLVAILAFITLWKIVSLEIS